MRLLALAVTAFFMTNCVTTHEGPVAEVNHSLKVSCAFNHGTDVKPYRFVEFSFENVSAEPQEIMVKSVQITKGSAQIPTSQDLLNYQKQLADIAKTRGEEDLSPEQIEKNRAAKALLLSLVMIAASESSGSGVSPGSAGALMGPSLLQSGGQKRIQLSEEHILGGPITLPAKTSKKRILAVRARDWNSDSDFKICMKSSGDTCLNGQLLTISRNRAKECRLGP